MNDTNMPIPLGSNHTNISSGGNEGNQYTENIIDTPITPSKNKDEEKGEAIYRAIMPNSTSKSPTQQKDNTPISVSDYTPGPFDYDAQISNFDKKKIVEVRRIYQDTGFGQLVDIQSAQDRLGDMQRELNKITIDVQELSDKKIDVDDRYDTIKQTMYRIIANIAQLNASIEKRLATLQKQTKQLYELRQALSITAREIDETQETLHTYIQMLYAVYNEVYDDTDNIDDTRLLITSDNIAQTTSQTTSLQALTLQIAELNNILKTRKEKYERTSRTLYQLKRSYQDEVDEYTNEMEYLRQQKVYLNDFYSYLQDDKVSIDSKYNEYLMQKKKLQEQVDALHNLVDKDWTDVTREGDVDVRPLLDIIDRPDSGTYFSRPVIPKGITATFKQESYKKYFGVDHLAIDLRGAQGDPIFAPADGVIYKIVESGGAGLSWMFVLHPHGYITVYLHVTEFLVQEGDYVKRGQQIAKIGGTPGTAGAGYMTTGPHLHREVYKNGEVIDPMTVLDLSPIKSEKLLPTEYKAKYHKDKTVLYDRIDDNQYLYELIYSSFYQNKGPKATIFYDLQQYSEEQGPYMFWLASALIMKESRFQLYHSATSGIGKSCDDVYTNGRSSGNAKIRTYTNAHYDAFMTLNIMGEHLLCSYLGAVGPLQYLPKWFVAFMEEQNYDINNFASDKDNIIFWYDVIIAKMKDEGLTDEDIKDLLTKVTINKTNDVALLHNIDREHPVIDFLEEYNGGSYQGPQTLNYATYIANYLVSFSRGEKIN